MTLNARDRERIVQQNHARQEGWARWSTPFRYIAFLVGVIAIIVGLWYLIAEQSEPTYTSSLETILPEEEPYKVKVDEQEILSVRHQDKLVYSRIHKGGEIPSVEHLLPAPEAPVLIEAVEEQVDKPVEVIIEGLTPEELPEPSKAQTAEEKTTTTTQPKIVEAIVETNGSEDSIASLISQAGLDTPSSGPFVQLGTLDSQEQAQQEWKRLKGRHKDILTQSTPLIERVDLGERGIRYRLRVGPYDKLADAKAASEELKTRKVGCIVIP